MLILSAYLYDSVLIAKNVLLVSIPKCGTHLAMRAIYLLTGIKGRFSFTLKELYDTTNDHFIVGHFRANAQKDLVDKDCICFFNYRDPRDQVVSYAHHVLYVYPEHPYLYSYKNKTIDELLFMFINEGKESWWKRTNVKNIKQGFELYLPWLKNPRFCAIRFEDLVGQKGGGSDEAQLHTLKMMAAHLGIKISGEKRRNIIEDLNNCVQKAKKLTNQELSAIADNLFGGSAPGSQFHTFRAGQIGSWKSHFNENHKKCFKKVAGKLLIDLGYESDFNW